jgi:ABC-type multidrug transport system permease subunit
MSETKPMSERVDAASGERLSPLRELILARIRSFVREPEALFWTFVFPILMAVGLGIAFRESPTQTSLIGVERGSAAERFIPSLQKSKELEIRVLDPAAAERALRRGEVAVVLAGSDVVTFRYDAGRAESRVARLLADDALQGGAGATRPVATRDDGERRPGGRYIDWVIPGLIGLNLMQTGMWGLGFGLVQMRQKKQLKRLVSTPMLRRDFLLAQMLARLTFLSFEVPPLLLFAWLVFGVRIQGSVLLLCGLILLGAITFAGIGLLAASRARTIEGVSGVLNVVMLPMFVLSGIFFSSSRYPDAIQPVIQALPLTALNDALRAVYNEGEGMAAVAGDAAILLAWAAVSFFLALRAFRWQ